MLKYPETPIQPVTDTLHGQKVTDNYRWLENLGDKHVQEWVKAQNDFTEQTIEQNTQFTRLKDSLTKHFNVPTFDAPEVVGGTYFWTERKPGQEQPVLYVKTGLQGKPRKLIDPNGLNATNTVSLDYWFESTSGKYVAYGFSEGGNEKPSLRIRTVESGKDLADVIPNASFTSLRWLPDDSGFFYTRGPRPGTVPTDEERHWVKVYLHILGNNPETDELVFGDGRPKDDMLGLTLTLDGRYLGIWAAQNWNRNDLFVYDTKSKQLRELIVGLDAQFNIYSTADRWIVKTNYKAKNNRVLAAPTAAVPASIDDWEEFVPETGDILEWIGVTADKILVGYMVDASDRVKVLDHQGTVLRELPIPPFSTLAALSTRRAEKEFFFSITNFVTPQIIYRYDPTDDKYVEYRKSDEPLAASDYVVKQEWFTSKDGTKVPMFIVHHKDVALNGSNPTILYGYGCHGTPEQPGFVRSAIPWLQNKGVYAIANIRGGGEYGEQWHRDGSLAKKQNTFDDFIAAAEHLIAQHYTSPEHLGIRGGSNGGLMVGAVMTQRPDLMRAVVCQVPVLDLYRFNKFLIADRWVHEFGNPDKPEEFEWLKQWSPYHHVAKDTEYPNVLLTAGMNDTRVHPLHAWKMAARLQATNKHNVVLLRTEMMAGHGTGKPLGSIIESSACALAFLAWQLGLQVR